MCNFEYIKTILFFFRNDISDLTLQLFESQQEADEHYRGGVQNNLQAIELNKRISQLTVGMAADMPWLTNSLQVCFLLCS